MNDDLGKEIHRRKKDIEILTDNFIEVRRDEKKLRKASEMLWCIVNNLVWVIDKLRSDVDLRQHSEIVNFLRGELTKEINNIDRYVADANTLHRNFFHNELRRLDFEVYSKSVLELIDELQKIVEKEIVKNSLRT